MYSAPRLSILATLEAVLLTIAIGWLLWVGQAILLPIIAALITLYILSAAAGGLARVPGLGWTPGWLRRVIVLLLFLAGTVALSAMVTSNVNQAVLSLPLYAENIEALVARTAGQLGFAEEPAWEALRAWVAERVNVGQFAGSLLGTLSSLGGQVVLVVLYAAFLFVERTAFERKLTLAFGDSERRDRARAFLAAANDRIGNYLVVKTVVNILLGAISLVMMLALGIDFAVFWAVLIGLLNYIPYIGSLVGVAFPVLLALAQFGSLGIAVVTLVLLTIAQQIIGSWVEPRMMSRAFNLSTFVVLLSLSFWASIWGLAGAILAVPMTSILVIILAEIETTRPVAVMLSADGQV
ncbi:AI-2E family transporter [Jannaschia seohaensis]|uniref:Predicted PurR-regulated permease PerM n=1 Tax=Jannaschia seohaensis TaxID=475081 RepID=A0A2Y9AU39_9RHOB|nr:AI-2E family transporter [Jannaschia seohaensis]PWJ18323.1 putative PurR-regulated permease PerM [Jannaschia seohaensis]SSA46848.1 Predicted PurR-regulated permease PerM [Jannaschia seohaensis]